MNYQTKIKWAFASAIFAAICWIIGDMYVAGFEVNPEDYPLFSQNYADDVDLQFATLMLEGSTERLMFGALIAAMTAPFYLPGMWLMYQFFKDKSRWYAWGTYFILMASVVLSPLGHAGFFYTGEIYKAIYHTDFLGKTTLPRWAGFITPVFLFIYQLPLNFIISNSEMKGYLGSAGFNISYLIFFLLLQIWFRQKLIS